MYLTSRWFFIVCLSLTLFACGTTSSQLHKSNDSSLPNNIGIHGYSPVSYFENDSAERGSAEHHFTYKNKIFYFTSEDQLETFKQNPKKYLPKFGEHCPYSLALGRRVAIDPTNFRIHDNELLLFHSDVELNTIDIKTQNDIISQAEEYNVKLLGF